MTADAAPVKRTKALSLRFSVTPFVELLVLAVAIAIATGSYFIIVSGANSPTLLTPLLVALLLVSNLVPGVALLVLLGRRIAMRRAARSPMGGRGRLHVRLVALFSVIAAVPTLLLVIFASLLFQYGVEFWFSDRARGMLENATSLAQENYKAELHRVSEETLTMSGDLADYLKSYSIDSDEFSKGFGFQVFRRNLSEAVITRVMPDGQMQALALVNPYDRALDRVITAPMITGINRGSPSVIVQNKDRAAAVVKLAYGNDTYLYAARIFDPQLATQLKRGETILSDYRTLQTRSRSLQLKFNAALLFISLLIVGIAVWIALEVADRLVRPVGELVAAAHRVATGDLTARVPTPKTDDEVGTLGTAFNQMTRRLQEQTGALESRRALIEAVMSGVTAGVISIAGDGTIRLINRSAAMLLHTGDEDLVGKPLADISPELDAVIRGETREAIVEVDVDGEPRTLAVKIARADEGPILTFDDITGQLLDQRRAAWADVARRIAHEIKNPLTPIQLAAERLQRRYNKQLPNDDGTFTRLTETIVRQVGDLRRMVDEFSSFARMPKPTFHEESLVDIARQTLFLHEVAHPSIRFDLVHDDPAPMLVCDRRQIGQALTNIVKNAVEAIDARGEGSEGAVTMTLTQQGASLAVTVADDGVGLPAARERLVEPYVTTRARGTGLGLAIVKKIVEEHCGTIAFTDREGGGTVVTMVFDTASLAAMDTGGRDTTEGEDRRTPELTRNRT
ncbi:Nitrogen regulation protein NtrY [hydrothermal vent metagenome]|jgi:two-component system nitrogen regulation sensor histidine kinase NtrY|uniref:histidine kinase n=1 Tax=hydrothermal vent metagenome TaxID=652676 RepID=A0A160TNL4_9ZZZZ